MTVGYTRLSMDKYGDQLGVTRQREDIAALARSLRWPDVTEFYEDNDVSANTDKKRPRPEFDRLLQDMRAGRVEHVLCYDQDRLVRDMRQLEDVVEAVETGHVLLTSVNGDIDLLTDNGRMVARIKAAVARHEVEKMSRRMKRERLQRAQRGIKQSGRDRTFGYTRDFQVVPQEAAILVELFERRATGEAVSSLQRWLNEARVESSRGNVGHWNYGTIVGMLRRREYVGDSTFNGEVVAKTAFDPIVSRATFDKANSHFATEPPAWLSLEDLGLLTGLLVCGQCGRRMRHPRGIPKERLYQCICYRRDGGARVFISDSLDAVVCDEVRGKRRDLSGTGLGTSLRSMQEAALEHEAARVRAGRHDSRLPRAARDVLLQHLERRLAEERSQRAKLPSGEGEPEQWESWDLDARRRWLAEMVSQIVVVKRHSKPSPRVDLGRVSIHFHDGEVRNLARE